MSVTMREMLEAGVHFGHQTRFWNPKMAPFIFGHRNKIHIINLEKTMAMYQDAMKTIKQISANRGTILLVGTKRQARDIIAAEAQRAGVPYVDQRWLGGMLTNFKTIKTSIKRLKDTEAQIESGETEKMSKKEALMFSRELIKLQKSIGGIKDLGGVPDAIFVVDVGYHKGAITEAGKLGIPVIGVVDTDCDPDHSDVQIPANDDAIRSVALILDQLFEAVEAGKNLRKERGIPDPAENRQRTPEAAPVPRPSRGNRGRRGPGGGPGRGPGRPGGGARPGQRRPMPGGVNRAVEIQPLADSKLAEETAKPAEGGTEEKSE